MAHLLLDLHLTKLAKRDQVVESVCKLLCQMGCGWLWVKHGESIILHYISQMATLSYCLHRHHCNFPLVAIQHLQLLPGSPDGMWSYSSVNVLRRGQDRSCSLDSICATLLLPA